MSINTEYEEKINDAIYTFENVKSINELQKLTLDFLQGKIISTNYHYGPLHKESKKIINELIKMNEFGFITVNSQPGEIEETRRQRGYVCGLIKKNQIDKFNKLMYEISNNIYIRSTNDDTIINSLLRIGVYPEWYWISENSNNKYSHVSNQEHSFCSFEYTDIYDELIENYYEIEIIDLEWGRINYIHHNITVVLNMINNESE
jgi:hypothetical protein